MCIAEFVKSRHDKSTNLAYLLIQMYYCSVFNLITVLPRIIAGAIINFKPHLGPGEML